MRYGFINNFSQFLAADLSAGATTLTLDGGGSLLSNASADLVYTLTLDDGEGTVEIVHVTGASGNDLTIERGKEGTTDAAWPTGSTVEMRVTAGVIGEIETKSVGTVNPVGRVTLGGGTVADGADNGISIGSGAYVEDYSGANNPTGAIAVGADSYAFGQEDVVAGFNSYTDIGLRNCLIGPQSAIEGSHSISAGASTYVLGNNAVAMGLNAYALANDSVAIGPGALTDIVGGLQVNAIPYLPASPRDNASSSGTSVTISAPNSARRAAAQIVLETDALDLTDGAAAVTLDLPAGTMLFIDAIDVIITGSDTPGGSPEIVVGPDDVTPAAYLAATAVGKTAVGGREVHSPLVSDGVTSLRVATTTAGTGTTYQAKVIFRGYVMEL